MRRQRFRTGGVVLGAVLLASASAAVVTVLAQPADAATNACRNPVLANNANGWGSLDNSRVTRDPVSDLSGVQWGFDTGGRRFYMPSLSVTTGQSWTFAARDRVVSGSGTAQLVVEWYGADGAYLGDARGPAIPLPASTSADGTWTGVSTSVTVPSGAATAHVLQQGDFGTATGTKFKATACDYEQNTTEAAVKHGWGSPLASQSDEYDGTAVDLGKWVLFGTSPGKTSGCTPGINGHGQRCGSQTTEGGGYLTVNGTADGKTGGLAWRGNTRFRYGRVEVRERAYQLSSSGSPYHVTPLFWPSDGTGYKNAEIDFGERDVNAAKVAVFVHHDGTQSSATVKIDSTQFHNYAIDWEPGTVTWYVDGMKIATINADNSASGHTNGGSQMDMNYATGTPMRPSREDVDWIRFYPSANTQFTTT